jgi:murein DD-endopeptidase MepM/ murein hydrolase activator NlpD
MSSDSESTHRKPDLPKSMKKSIFLIVSMIFFSLIRVSSSLAVEITPVNNRIANQGSSKAINKVLQKSQELRDQQELFQPIFPLTQKITISSNFGGRRDPFSGQWGEHHGVDFPATIGTPIMSTEAGVVKQAGFVSGYGNLVEIDHGQGYTSKYGHSSEILVTPGQSVKKGQIIARVGSSGYSTGPHLHFEMAHLGQVFNPLSYLTEGFALAQKNMDTFNSPIRKSYIINSSSVSRAEKLFYSSGDLVASVRVRSGKPVKW